jgi:hypothetical protein
MKSDRAISEEITPKILTTDAQSVDSSITNRMPRRDLFRLAGISVAATSFGGVSLAFADSAAAQEVSNQCLKVTNLPSENFLRKAAISASQQSWYRTKLVN